MTTSLYQYYVSSSSTKEDQDISQLSKKWSAEPTLPLQHYFCLIFHYGNEKTALSQLDNTVRACDAAVLFFF